MQITGTQQISYPIYSPNALLSNNKTQHKIALHFGTVSFLVLVLGTKH